jgi:hypothetical protein
MRPTPFSYVFGEIAEVTFPAIDTALDEAGGIEADRDQFVLLEPVGRLLRDLVPEDAGPDRLEAHVRLLHHAYCHWAARGWVYRIGEAALGRVIDQPTMTQRLPRPALYLQLPELRVWGSPTPDAPPEPLDGMFVMESLPGGIAVLGIFGMRPDRPGFSAVSLEGWADPDDPHGNEIEIAAEREDGSPAFTPLLPGGSSAGLYSLANSGELLLLTTRLLTLLPLDPTPDPPRTAGEAGGALEHLVAVD